jgi:hypothetical protein
MTVAKESSVRPDRLLSMLALSTALMGAASACEIDSGGEGDEELENIQYSSFDEWLYGYNQDVIMRTLVNGQNGFFAFQKPSTAGQAIGCQLVNEHMRFSDSRYYNDWDTFPVGSVAYDLLDTELYWLTQVQVLSPVAASCVRVDARGQEDLFGADCARLFTKNGYGFSSSGSLTSINGWATYLRTRIDAATTALSDAIARDRAAADQNSPAFLWGCTDWSIIQNPFNASPDAALACANYLATSDPSKDPAHVCSSQPTGAFDAVASCAGQQIVDMHGQFGDEYCESLEITFSNTSGHPIDITGTLGPIDCHGATQIGASTSCTVTPSSGTSPDAPIYHTVFTRVSLPDAGGVLRDHTCPIQSYHWCE